MDLIAGQLFDEKYRIVRALGAGGMGTVFEAVHEQFSRRVALKILHEAISDDTAKARFEREAKTVSSLAHKSIVKFYGYGICDGRPYIVMEYVDGISLHGRIKQSGSLSVPQSLAIMLQILQALAYAHASGVVHRDLKPQNIMLAGPVSAPTVKLIDFGLVKVLHGDQPKSQSLTYDGRTVGTASYMSPEQCMGLDVDGRSDIYSLGCVLYECITGTLPFIADDTAKIMRKHVDADVLQPVDGVEREIPVSVREIIFRALKKDRAERYGSAAEMLASVESASLHEYAGLAQQRKPSLISVIGYLGAALALTLTLVSIVSWICRPHQAPSLSSIDLLRTAEALQGKPESVERMGLLSQKSLQVNEHDRLLSDRRVISAYCMYIISLNEGGKLRESSQVVLKGLEYSARHRVPLDARYYTWISNLITHVQEDPSLGICEEIVQKLLTEHPAPEPLKGHEAMVKAEAAAYFAVVGDFRKALSLFPPGAPYANKGTNENFLYVVFRDQPLLAAKVGRVFLAQPAQLSPKDNARALRSLIRAEIALDMWSDAKKHSELLSPEQLSDESSAGIRMLFLAHSKQWSEAESLHQLVMRNFNRDPRMLFAHGSDFDLLQYARLLQAHGAGADARKIRDEVDRMRGLALSSIRTH